MTLKSDSDPAIELNQQLSGESLFLAYTTLFYATSLDRDRTYTLTVTNLENKTLAIQGMNITVLDGGERYDFTPLNIIRVEISRLCDLFLLGLEFLCTVPKRFIKPDTKIRPLMFIAFYGTCGPV